MIVVCVICSDILNPSDNLYVTLCGHLFHYHCLHTWIVKAQTCPQCRNQVTKKSMFRFYPTTTDTLASKEENASTLQAKLDDAMLKISQQSVELKAFEDRDKELSSALEKAQNTVKSLHQKLASQTSALTAHRDKINYLKIEIKKLSDIEKELELSQKKMQALQGLQVVFNGTIEEVDSMLEGYPDVRTVATFAIALKRALFESESNKSELRNKLQDAKSDLTEQTSKYNNLKLEYNQLAETLSEVKKNYITLKNKLKNNAAQSPDDSAGCSMLKPKLSVSSRSLDEPILLESDTSLTTMIKKIEDADSPYMSLKQSNMAWEAIKNPTTSKDSKKKSLASIVNTARFWSTNDSFNICNESKNIVDYESESNGNIAYDGLGGHAPSTDTMPKPKSSIPKLTAKHRLKRPNPDGTPTLKEFLKKQRFQND